MRISSGKIREIAKITIQQEDISEKLLSLILEKFNREEIKLFLKYLKKEVEKNIVFVGTTIEPDSKFKRKIEQMFFAKKIAFSKDEKLGAGIAIKDFDNFLNLNIKSIIFETIERLKHSV